MDKKYFSETHNRTPKPRSKRLRALGASSGAAGGSTVVSINGESAGAGDGHTHTNKASLDEISTDENRYIYLTKEETPDNSEGAVFKKEKAKVGYADESGHAKTADEADEAAHSQLADEAEDSKHWEGHKFGDYLDQPVREGDNVSFNGVKTDNIESKTPFNQGLLGSGFQLAQQDGKSRLEVDELLVRMKAYFASLEIRELSYVGGNYVFSSAGSRIYYVERVAEGWKCYFYTDNGTTSTMNYWKVGDQARCQTFNIEEGVTSGAKNKYYWRKVVSVGCGRIAGKMNADGTNDLTEYQWAVLSDTDFDGDDVPEVNDRLVQMGSRNIESRQGLIYLVVEGENAPAIMQYSGVGAEYPYYKLPEPTLLLSPKKNIIHGEFHSVAYGDGGTGSIDQQIQDLMDQLEAVKAQSDQKMDIWFYSHSPLPSREKDGLNEPASDWDSEELKAMHLQDLFYDTSRTPGSSGGRAWRWVYEDGRYFWAEVTDLDTLAALEKIADVASDGILTGGAEKSRVLVDWNACVSEYDKYVGQAEEFKNQKPELVSAVLEAYKTAFVELGTMLNGGVSWTASDSVPSWLAHIQEDTTIPDPSNYREKWAVYYSALSALLKAITDAAKSIADDAQDAADDAQETADGAVTQLENMAADNIITLQEKLTLSHLWDNVKATHTQLNAEAVKYAVAHADYDNAFNAISTLVEKILASTTDYTLTVSDDYATKWTTYYTQESALYAAIVTAAKKVADDAQKAADDAQTTADGAVTQLENMAADNIITLQEKLTLSHLWDNVKATHTQLDAEAVKYNVAHTDYDNAFNAISTLVEKILGSTTDYTLTVSDDYATKWTTYYTQESALYAAIVTAAKKVADDAQKAADDAQTTADGAVSQLENMAADNIITLQEKLTLSHLWDNVKATHTQLDAEAVKYGVAHTDYDNAFNAIRTLVEKILASTTDYTLTASDGYATKWAAYYTQESTLYAAVVTAAKKIADDAQQAADDAMKEAEKKAQVFVEQPVPPYKVGDLWFCSNGGKKICIIEREENETFQMGDWQDFTEEKETFDKRTTLAQFANVYQKKYGSLLKSSEEIKVYLSTSESLMPELVMTNESYTLNSIRDLYLATDKFENVTLNDGAWSPTVPQLSESKKYLWHIVEATTTNRGKVIYGQPRLIHTYRGRDKIVKVKPYYQTIQKYYGPSTWSETPVMPGGSKPCLWMWFDIQCMEDDTYSSDLGNIKFDGACVYVCTREDSRWSRSSMITDENDSLFATLKTLQEVFGGMTITVTTMPRVDAIDYDLAIRIISYTDTFKNETKEGPCEILMFYKEKWELLQESITAMIDNLGDELRLIVFGADGTNSVDTSGLITQTRFNELFSQRVILDATGKVTNIDKSGLLTTANFATLFSSALAADGTVVKKSEITAFVTKDEKGYLQSGVKIKADAIELEGAVTANNYFKVNTDGSIEAKYAKFTDAEITGIIKSNLFYSRVKKNAPNSYSIDPTTEAYSSFYWDYDAINGNMSAGGSHWIYLPDANTYDGIEFTFRWNCPNNAILKYLFVSGTNGQKVVITDNYINTQINGKLVTLPILNGRSREDTRFYCLPNQQAKVKAIGGKWHLIEGSTTEE